MSKKKKKIITIISAPDVPSSEVAILRGLWDDGKDIYENYDFEVMQIEVTPGCRLMVKAPGVPASELKALKAHVEEAIGDPDYTVVTNYEVTVQVVE
jgi:hypothetical protein